MKTFINNLEALEESSIRIILKNQSPTGGYIASPNFAVYNYSWFRDGAFIAHSMLRVGEIKSAEAFHLWAARNINKRAGKIDTLIERSKAGEKIDPEDHLHCRYSVDGRDSEEEWTNFQLDGFGTWLWSLNEYRNAGFALTDEMFLACKKIIPYLIHFWGEPSFDWWEESFGHQHVSTLGCISAGLAAIQSWHEIESPLKAAAFNESEKIYNYVMREGILDGQLTKWIGSTEIDGSLAALVAPLNWVKNREVEEKTLNRIATELGELGTHRHRSDDYFGGGAWPLLSVFLALGRRKLGDTQNAIRVLEWIGDCANENLELPEQLSDHLLHPESRENWIKRWGIPAEPLLWSHAMFLILKKEVEGNE